MYTPLKSLNGFAQLVDLTLIEMTNWRWSWRSLIITATLTPLLNMFFLGNFARDRDIETLIYIFTGNIMLTLLLGTMQNIIRHVTFIRIMGMLDYFLTLPIYIPFLIIAMVVTFFFLSLPSVLTIIIVGYLFFEIPIQPNLLGIIVIPLISLSLAGIGALIGSYPRTLEEGGSISLLISIVLIGVGPVLIPASRLPDWIITLGYFNPATYASSAIRQVLIGPVTEKLWVDMGILLTITIVSLIAVSRKITKF